MSQAGANSTSSGSAGDGILTLTGNSGGAVGPDVGGNVSLVGTGTVTVTGTPGSNLLEIGVSGSSWVQISNDDVLTTNTSYICVSPGGVLLLQLPGVSSQGDIIRIVLAGATGFKLTQDAGQSITYGSITTTVGTGGSITSIGTGNTLSMVCIIANTKWQVMATIGNYGVV